MESLIVQDSFEPYFAGRRPFAALARAPRHDGQPERAEKDAPRDAEAAPAKEADAKEH